MIGKAKFGVLIKSTKTTPIKDNILCLDLVDFK